MRQERIRKTPQRRPRPSQPEPHAEVRRPVRTVDTSIPVLRRIAEVLEEA